MNKIKRLLCVLFTLVLMFSFSIEPWTLTSAKETSASNSTYKIKSKQMNIYVLTNDEQFTDKIDLYYVNGSDVPYMEISKFVELKEITTKFIFQDFKYKLKVKKSGNNVKLIRENGSYAKINFAKDTIYFLDYNMFFQKSYNELIDLVTGSFKDENNQSYYIKRQKSKNTVRLGNSITFNLNEYNIDLVHEGDLYLIPVQTLSDIFMSQDSLSLLYNGKSLIVYLASINPLINEDGSYTDLGKVYYGKKNTNTISKEMAEYNYFELCFVFDHFYGLKESHKIESFHQLVCNNCLLDYFLSTDPCMVDMALYRVITDLLDDGHSSFETASYATGNIFDDNVKTILGIGRTNNKALTQYMNLFAARLQAFPQGVLCYQEIGDTAFITFDEFSRCQLDYYSYGYSAGLFDTYGIISYSVQQILRKKSPIKNVVLDLSLNMGGDTAAAIYTLGAFLDVATSNIEDTNTGALVTCDYKVDTNLDHKFNSKDTLAGKGLNLYCLTSGVSFSCANFVPYILKHSNAVTILGQTTGGGACTVMPFTSAIGSVFNISSTNRISYLKNGSYYNVDLGVTPDYTISKPEHFYDREALVEYIHNLF